MGNSLTSSHHVYDYIIQHYWYQFLAGAEIEKKKRKKEKMSNNGIVKSYFHTAT